MKKAEKMRAFCEWYQTLSKGVSLDISVNWFNQFGSMQKNPFQEEVWKNITVDEAEKALLLWDGQ